jgi:acyl-CoA thioester hydrolase
MSDISRKPADYRLWTPGRVRFGDLDPLGHANNNAVGLFFDDARIDMLAIIGVSQLTRETLCVLAKMSFEFLAELHMFDDVRIGQRVPRIGNTSFTIHSAIFRGEQCMATGDGVCVLIDAITRKPKPLTEEQRKILGQYA